MFFQIKEIAKGTRNTNEDAQIDWYDSLPCTYMYLSVLRTLRLYHFKAVLVVIFKLCTGKGFSQIILSCQLIYCRSSHVHYEKLTMHHNMFWKQVENILCTYIGMANNKGFFYLLITVTPEPKPNSSHIFPFRFDFFICNAKLKNFNRQNIFEYVL